MSDEEYLRQSAVIAQEFRQVGEDINATPMPDFKGKSRPERLSLLSQRLKQDAARYVPVAQKMRDLHPPAALKEHQRVHIDLIQGTADHMDAWGEAIASGDRVKAETAADALDTHLLTSMDRLVAVTEQLGLDSTQLKTMRDELRQEVARFK